MGINDKEIMDEELDEVIGGQGSSVSIDTYNVSINIKATDTFEMIRTNIQKALQRFNMPINGIPSVSELQNLGIKLGMSGTLLYECKRSDGSMVKCYRS